MKDEAEDALLEQSTKLRLAAKKEEKEVREGKKQIESGIPEDNSQSKNSYTSRTTRPAS